MITRQPEVEGRVETYVEVSGIGWSFEVEADVYYLVNAYDPGNISGPIERCYPPEGGEVEVLDIRLHCRGMNIFDNSNPDAFSDYLSWKIKNQIKRSAEENGDLADEIHEDAAERIETYREMAAEAKQGRLLHAMEV